MTPRQKKIARKRRLEKRKKFDKVCGCIENCIKFIGWMVATAVFLVVFVAHVEANPDRTILLLEIAAAFTFALWFYWRLFIKGEKRP